MWYDNWVWKNYTKVRNSKIRCNLCNKIQEATSGKPSKKAAWHLFKEHAIFNIDRTVFHNCWIYYKLLTGYRAICNICGKIYDNVESRYLKKHVRKIYPSTILEKFLVRKYYTQSGRTANCNFCSSSYNFTHAVKWVEKYLLELHAEKTTFH